MISDQLNPDKKIMSLPESIEWRTQLRGQSKKLVFTNGCFDIIHKGHVEYLYRARECGDALLIAMNSDSSVRQLKGDSRPIISENDRAYLLASLIMVDAVVIFETCRCTDLLRGIQPDVYVKGGDYTIDTIDEDEKNVLMEVGSEIKFIPFVPGFSTSEILTKIVNL